MSEDFVDVTWRGLEVAHKARLRGTGPRSAYVEHATPMPTGSQLTIRTADGLELTAVVSRVQEQIGGRSEPPGMELSIAVTGAAATWWLERAEAVPPITVPPITVPPITVPPITVPPIDATVGDATVVDVRALEAQATQQRAASRATMSMPIASVAALVPPPIPEADVEVDPVVTAPVVPLPMVPIETGPTRPSARATAVTMPPPAYQPRTDPPAVAPDESRRTDLMFSVRALEAAEAEQDNGDAIPTGIDDSADRPDDEIVDDGRRTMIMPAVDIAAIVEAGARPDPDDSAGGDKKKAKGKKRRGR